MRIASKIVAAAATVLLLGGCVSMPTGPSVMALPGTGKSFDQFRADDVDCRQYASSQVGGSSPDQAAESSGVKSAAVGTALGAAAGALVGGRSGAATGAAAGLVVGGAAGANAAGSSQYALQRRYDNGYVQCMYAKGHKVPTAGRYENSRRSSAGYTQPPPPDYAPPPPPAGAPPPPPPGMK